MEEGTESVIGVLRLASLEIQMTYMEGGTRHPGGKTAFDAMYRMYGLPGVEALANAGHDTPEKLWIFYNDVCFRYVDEMARKVGLIDVGA
jgi:hypothetical protein